MDTDNRMEPMVYNVPQAAAALKISRRTLWKMVVRGGLPHVRIGRRLFFRPEALAEWVERQEQVKARV